MKRNKIKVLSSLAILGIAGIGLAACGGSKTTTPVVSTPSQGTSVAPSPTQGTSVAPSPTQGTSVAPSPTQGTNSTPAGSTTTSSTEQKVLEEIAISGQKTEFTVGDEFSLGDIVVTKMYSDGSEEEAQSSEIEHEIYSGNNKVTSINAVGTYKVVITVDGKTANYNIEVKNEQIELKETWTSASLATGEFKEDKELYSNNGNKITISASSDRSYKVATDDGASVLNLNGTTGVTTFDATAPRVLTIVVANKGTVSITCCSSTGDANKERSAIFTNGTTVTHEDKTELKGNKKTYTYEVEAGTYYFYCGASNATLGTSAGGIYIYDISFGWNVDVSKLSFTSLELDTTSAKIDFNVGDTFNTDGLGVIAKTSDGVNATISSYQVSNVDMTTPGKKTVTITYGNLTATYDIQVINPNATVESIEVKTEAKNLIYRQGETLSLAGLVLTATDSDSLVQDVEYDATKVSHKVLNGEEVVTDNFTTLTKGTYEVEVTYEGKSVKYNIVILEEESGIFSGEQYIKVGTTSYSTELVINYTDGTDADYSKYYTLVADSDEGYSVAYYSDEACTNAYDNAETAFAQVGIVYVKCTYRSYSGVVTIYVKSTIEEYSTNSLKSGIDYSGQQLYESSLGTLTAMTHSKGVKSASQNDEVYIKFENSSERGVTLTLTDTIIVQFIINGNGGNKKFVLADSTGNIINLGDNTDATCSCVVQKNTDNYVFTAELSAGTYNLYSNTGGLMFGGIRLIK